MRDLYRLRHVRVDVLDHAQIKATMTTAQYRKVTFDTFDVATRHYRTHYPRLTGARRYIRQDLCSCGCGEIGG